VWVFAKYFGGAVAGNDRESRVDANDLVVAIGHHDAFGGVFHDGSRDFQFIFAVLAFIDFRAQVGIGHR